MDWEAARISIWLALLTALLLIAPAVWLARWLAITPWRGRPLIEALLTLPLLLPPTVIGFYLLIAFGTGSPVGHWLAETAGVKLVFTFEGLLLASMLVNLPFMAQPVQRAFAAIPQSVREAAWVSGLSGWRTLWRVELPLAWPGIVAGVALTFAHTLGEFGVVLMVGGSIAGQTKTISIAIYDRVQAFDNTAAAIMSLALLLFSLIAIAVVFYVGQRQRRALQER